jgi:tetratricopeptide (TPR) repeat protein
MFAIAGFILALAALLVAGWIIARHWKELILLDPRSIKEEREREQREVLIRRRFDRMRTDRFSAVVRLGRRLSSGAKEAYANAYQRLKAFEAVYQNMATPFAAVAPSTRERIKGLLSEARSLARDLKWADAERRYLEMLSIEPRNAEAYQGLGQIYLRQRLFPQAKETFEFVLKIKKADDATYSGLAEIAESEGQLPLAETYLLKASDLNPKSAHRQAELAEWYVAHGQALKAKGFARRAAELEPASAKYAELSLEVALAQKDGAEARKCYERLRLLTEDHRKYQSWKEKIDALEGDEG